VRGLIANELEVIRHTARSNRYFGKSPLGRRASLPYS
jgi:hypothetical protein